MTDPLTFASLCLMEHRTPDPQTDFLRPFGVEGSTISGYGLALGGTLDTILTQHSYPEPVNALLAQLLTLTALLYGSFKFEGILTLQVKGTGPLDLLVCDVNHEGGLRGYGHFDAQALEAHGAAPTDLKTLLGEGHLLIVVDPSKGARYQGVVALTGPTLVSCVEHYFTQSVQHPTKMVLAIHPPNPQGEFSGLSEADRFLSKATPAGLQGPGWRSGALMIQQHSDGTSQETLATQWEEALCHMGTIQPSELLREEPGGVDRLLYQLFHENGVRVHPAHPIKAQCRCSQEKIQSAIQHLMGDESRKALKDELVVCEFCGKRYSIRMPALEE